MNQNKIIRPTNELLEQILKSSATISNRNTKTAVEKWVSDYYELLNNTLSTYPKAIRALQYLTKSIDNKRLSRKYWVKSLRIIKKALSRSRLSGTSTFLIDPSKPFTAYKVLKGLFSEAKKEVLIFDGYVEDGTLDILSAIPQKLKVNLLTNNTYGNFMRELPKFKKEFPQFEARKSAVVHDRFFAVDGQYFISGTSLHSLGGKKASYIFKMDRGIGDILKTHFNNIWTQSTKL